MQIITDARAYIAAHPYLTAYAAVAVLSIALRLAGSAWWDGMKQRHPKLAGLLEVARGAGFDFVKIAQGLLRIAYAMLPPPISGNGGPGNATGDMKTAPGSAASEPEPLILHRLRAWIEPAAYACAACLVLAGSLSLSACSSLPSAATVRRDAGVASLTIAGGARVVDEACAEVALRVAVTDRTRGAAIASTCAAAYERTRAELLTLGHGLDAWANGAGGAPACAMLDVSAAARAQLDAARAFGAPVPDTVDAAIQVAAGIAADRMGTCVRSPSADGGADVDG
jgi:hypothetical protein